jgi:hypothetical protein
LAVKVIVDLCVVPIGVGVHLAPTIAACETVLTGVRRDRGLSPGGAVYGSGGEELPMFRERVLAIGIPLLLQR